MKKTLTIMILALTLLSTFSLISVQAYKSGWIKYSKINLEIPETGFKDQFFSVSVDEISDGSDISILLDKKGLTLLGYSSKKPLNVRKVIISDSSNVWTYEEAVNAGIITEIAYASFDGSWDSVKMLRQDEAYKIRTNHFEDFTITYPGVGGADPDAKIQWSDLYVLSETGILTNLTYASENEPYPMDICLYSFSGDNIEFHCDAKWGMGPDYIQPWQGYWTVSAGGDENYWFVYDIQTH